MESNGEEASHNMSNVLEFQPYHSQEDNHQEVVAQGGGGGGFFFPATASASASASPATTLPPSPWHIPPIHPLNINHFAMSSNHDRFFPPLPPLPPPPPSIPPLPSFYGDLYARRASSGLQFAYEGSGGGIDHLGLAGLYNYVGGMSPSPSSSPLPFAGLHAELGKMSAQEIMDAKALAASKSHSEAERRRRERINAHFAKLRSLLPSTTKTDKASLLAEVIQHVKELKRQTQEIAEESALPTESDELTVDTTSDDDGRVLIRASLCCEDRPELLPDLIKALKNLSLRTLKAEITTISGRVRNVLVITADESSDESPQEQSIVSIQEALKAVMERPAAAEDSSGGGIKRQRTANLSNIVLSQ